MKDSMTTAESYGALRSELLNQGFDCGEAFEIVKIFARERAPEGFSVRAADA